MGRKRAERRTEQLQAITSALSSAVTPAEVADIFITRGAQSVGARAGAVLLLEGNDQLRVLATTGFAAEVVKRWETFPLGDPTPPGDAIRSRQPVWLESKEERATSYPQIPGSDPEHRAWAYFPLIVQDRVLGGLGLSFTQAQPFREDDKTFMMALAALCAQALDRANLYSMERQNRMAAETARKRLEFLSKASELLASSLDYTVTFNNLKHLILPDLADIFTIDALEANESLPRVAMAAVDPAVEALVREFNERFPTDVQGLLANPVFLSGQSILFAEITPATIEATVPDPAQRALLAKINPTSEILVPLRVRDTSIGILTVVRRGAQRPYTPDDVMLVEELAHRVSQSLDNVRLFAAEAQARREAELANQLKLKFLAMISHELRTPLTSIKGFATTLLATDVQWDPESQRSFIDTINEEADKLTELVNQLLDLSRLQAGTLSIHPERKAISDVVNAYLAQLESMTRHHRLIISIPPDLPHLMADPHRVGQVIVNLVHNSAKFAPAGTTITIAAVDQGAMVQIDVSDEGPGIPTDARSKLFEPFRQLETANVPHSKGAGLGLAICRGLIEAHGGKIWLNESTTSGTTMSFTLPISSIHAQ